MTTRQDGTQVPINPEVFMELTTLLSQKVAASAFRPTLIVALASGGFIPAVVLAKRLNIPSSAMLGLPVSADYSPLGDLSRIRGQRVLVVDDACNRGKLIEETAVAVLGAGAEDVATAVLLYRAGGHRPDFIADFWVDASPTFWWEDGGQ